MKQAINTKLLLRNTLVYLLLAVGYLVLYGPFADEAALKTGTAIQFVYQQF